MNSSSQVGKRPRSTLQGSVGGLGTAPHLKHCHGLSTSHTLFPFFCWSSSWVCGFSARQSFLSTLELNRQPSSMRHFFNLSRVPKGDCILISLVFLDSLILSLHYDYLLNDFLWPQHEGALPPPCIVRKDPRVPHTARRGA